MRCKILRRKQRSDGNRQGNTPPGGGNPRIRPAKSRFIAACIQRHNCWQAVSGLPGCAGNPRQGWWAWAVGGEELSEFGVG